MPFVMFLTIADLTTSEENQVGLIQLEPLLKDKRLPGELISSLFCYHMNKLSQQFLLPDDI